jgi:hypothetical protein
MRQLELGGFCLGARTTPKNNWTLLGVPDRQNFMVTCYNTEPIFYHSNRRDERLDISHYRSGHFLEEDSLVCLPVFIPAV